MAIERVKAWISKGNVPYPVHWLNILGLVSCLMALLLIIFAGLDIYTFILFLWFGVGGFLAWLFNWKRFISRV